MSRFIRPSKYRHVYGTKGKVSYENVKISGSAWDTDLITASGKYLAVNWQASGGGAFAVLPLISNFTSPQPTGFPTKLPDVLPLARGHTAAVLDTAWSPFDDRLVVSAGEDGKILIWNIQDSLFDGWGEDGWMPQDLAPDGRLNAGGRKVGQVVFNPVASSVLASASGDHLVRLWDIEHGQDAAKITLKGHGDTIQSIAWNATGTQLATTCRDKKLRLFDPRAGVEAVRITDGHGGIKGSRVVFLGDRDRIATTGFSKMSDRQVILWETGGMTALETTVLDSSAGNLMPYFSEGNDVLFISGKGDGNIRYYEYEGDSLHHLSDYKSSDPQRGMCFLPRRALNVGENEIARAFKVAGQNIESLAFVVPRKAENFQSDIFPPAASDQPALSAAQWFEGKNAAPKYIDLESGAAASSAPSPSPVRATPAVQTLKEVPSKSVSAPAAYSSPAPAPAAAKEAPLPETKDLEIPQEDEEDSEPEAEAVPVPVPAPAAVSSPRAESAPATDNSAEIESLKSKVIDLQSQLKEALDSNKNLESQLNKTKQAATALLAALQ